MSEMTMNEFQRDVLRELRKHTELLTSIEKHVETLVNQSQSVPVAREEVITPPTAPKQFFIGASEE